MSHARLTMVSKRVSITVKELVVINKPKLYHCDNNKFMFLPFRPNKHNLFIYDHLKDPVGPKRIKRAVCNYKGTPEQLFWPKNQYFSSFGPFKWPCWYFISFGPTKGHFGSQKAHIGIQKGPIPCWLFRTDILTPSLPFVVTKGTRAHLFWPNNQYLISFWASKGPFGSKRHISGSKGSHSWLGD